MGVIQFNHFVITQSFPVGLGLDLSFEIFDIVLLKEIASFHRSFSDSTSCELIDKSLDNFLRLEPEVESHPSKFVDLGLS